MGTVSMLVSLYAQAYPGESIVLDPISGNYIITYWDDLSYENDGVVIQPGLAHTTFVPATKIIPAISSKFQLERPDSVAYTYMISNGLSAKQAIVGVSLEQVGRITNERDFPAATATTSEVENAVFANMSALDSPDDWIGNIYREQSRIAWRLGDLETGGVQAGRTQAGFGFSSLALPGLSTARMKGIGAIFGYAGGGPAADSSIRPELERLRKNNFIAHNAAVPTIAVPTPFDAAVTLERIQAHMHTWKEMQLLDATLSSQLDRYFQSAADAYRLNQPKVGKKHIQTMRTLIKKEQPEADREDDKDDRDEQGDEDDKAKHALIDKLAARILDFDLKYVTKRMGGDKGD